MSSRGSYSTPHGPYPIPPPCPSSPTHPPTGFYVASLASATEDFPSRLLFILAGNFAGLYYLMGITLELSLAATILYSTYRYGTNAAELLTAIRTLAGPASGLNLVDKAATVVNMVKVLGALEEVSRLMQVRGRKLSRR